mmetsp:Transcript_19630/g.29373  ORF Transcript_19630/g.29373 Transcript_19630/m.29373 type:complete len:332 (-) Transcript_19630:417-1412(-)
MNCLCHSERPDHEETLVASLRRLDLDLERLSFRRRDLERRRSRDRDRRLSPREGRGERRRCLLCCTRFRQTCSQSKLGSFLGLPSLSRSRSLSLSRSRSRSLLLRSSSEPSFFSSLDFFFFLSSSSHLSAKASAALILEWPDGFSAKTPSAVMPTMCSPTTSSKSAAGTKAHSSGGSELPGGGGSAVKSWRGRSQDPSGVVAHSATSFQSAAQTCRTSGSVQETAESSPRGRIALSLPLHFFAQEEGRGPESSSHKLPRCFLSASFSSLVLDQTRTLSFSWKSLSKPISGNCIMTVCQFPRTQSCCRLASAPVARFKAQRNCARSFFLEQS